MALLIAPDLMMFIDARPGGKLSPKAVPFYNAMHLPWIPLAVLVGYSFSDWDAGSVVHRRPGVAAPHRLGSHVRVRIEQP